MDVIRKDFVLHFYTVLCSQKNIAIFFIHQCDMAWKTLYKIKIDIAN